MHETIHEGMHDTMNEAANEVKNQGIRFDLAYDTMPWHKVDAVVFDIGNVLIHFAPAEFLSILFPDDEQKQKHMLAHVYEGPYWPCFDRGTMSYEEAAHRFVEEFGGSYEDYMHALVGWIELKTPIEEGWRTVRRCRRAGKKLYLLSNYPAEGYKRLREKFADYFADMFDGACISSTCHYMKPEPEMYKTLLEQYDIEPSRALFIDDRLDNIEGALRAGMNGFHRSESGMMDRFFL